MNIDENEHTPNKGNERGWTSTLEENIRVWKSNIFSDYKIHLERAISYNKLFYRLGVIAIIFNGLIFFQEALMLGNCDDSTATSNNFICRNSLWINIVSALISAISTSIVAVQTFFSFQKRSQKHHEAANNYETLIRLMTNLLHLDRDLRGDPLEVLDELTEIYESYMFQAPIIPRERKEIKFMNPNETFQDSENEDKVVIQIPSKKRDGGTKILRDIEKERCNTRFKNYGLNNALLYQMERMGARQTNINTNSSDIE